MSPRDFVEYSTGSEPASFWDVSLGACDTPEAKPSLAVGTMILTPNGELPVEYLQAGDRILTRNHGIQSIIRIETQMLSDAELRVSPALCPIMITRNALGTRLPCRDLLVAPTQRIPVRAADVDAGRPVHLLNARELVGRTEGVFVDEIAMAAAGVEYFALVLDQPCIIWADGLPVESFGLRVQLRHHNAAQTSSPGAIQRPSSASG